LSAAAGFLAEAFLLGVGMVAASISATSSASMSVSCEPSEMSDWLDPEYSSSSSSSSSSTVAVAFA
jgi:hypothetical protein